MQYPTFNTNCPPAILTDGLSYMIDGHFYVTLRLKNVKMRPALALNKHHVKYSPTNILPKGYNYSCSLVPGSHTEDRERMWSSHTNG